jgi:hypothetical protein
VYVKLNSAMKKLEGTHSISEPSALSPTMAEAQSNNIKSAQIPRPPDCTWHLADGPGVQDPRSGHRRWPTLCTAAGLSFAAAHADRSRSILQFWWASSSGT